MTDKELDDLEARLRGKTKLGNDATWKVSPLHKEAADAIAELRKEKAGLEGRVERLKAIARPLADEDWNPGEYPCDAPATCLDLLRHQARQALKENTQ